ncbi:MAG: flagellar protein FlaF [Natronomonas sp.]|jgi:flagellar protein FlaF
MGFSVSGATAVIFVGLLISTATLYPAVDRYAERRSEAITARNDRLLTRQNTAIEMVNATYNASTNRLTVSVQNTGSSTLAVSEIDLLVDGEYVLLSKADTTVGDDSATGLWAPGETLTITTTDPSAPNRIKIVTGPGIAVTATVGVI